MAKAKKVKKIRITKPSAGRFGISASVNDEITLEIKQMEAMVELGYAEWVK